MLRQAPPPYYRKASSGPPQPPLAVSKSNNPQRPYAIDGPNDGIGEGNCLIPLAQKPKPNQQQHPRHHLNKATPAAVKNSSATTRTRSGRQSTTTSTTREPPSKKKKELVRGSFSLRAPTSTGKSKPNNTTSNRRSFGRYNQLDYQPNLPGPPPPPPPKPTLAAEVSPPSLIANNTTFSTEMTTSTSKQATTVETTTTNNNRSNNRRFRKKGFVGKLVKMLSRGGGKKNHDKLLHSTPGASKDATLIEQETPFDEPPITTTGRTPLTAAMSCSPSSGTAGRTCNLASPLYDADNDYDDDSDNDNSDAEDDGSVASVGSAASSMSTATPGDDGDDFDDEDDDDYYFDDSPIRKNLFADPQEPKKRVFPEEEQDDVPYLVSDLTDAEALVRHEEYKLSIVGLAGRVEDQREQDHLASLQRRKYYSPEKAGLQEARFQKELRERLLLRRRRLEQYEVNEKNCQDRKLLANQHKQQLEEYVLQQEEERAQQLQQQQQQQQPQQQQQQEEEEQQQQEEEEEQHQHEEVEVELNLDSQPPQPQQQEEETETLQFRPVCQPQIDTIPLEEFIGLKELPRPNKEQLEEEDDDDDDDAYTSEWDSELEEEESAPKVFHLEEVEEDIDGIPESSPEKEPVISAARQEEHQQRNVVHPFGAEFDYKWGQGAVEFDHDGSTAGCVNQSFQDTTLDQEEDFVLYETLEEVFSVASGQDMMDKTDLTNDDSNADATTGIEAAVAEEVVSDSPVEDIESEVESDLAENDPKLTATSPDDEAVIEPEPSVPRGSVRWQSQFDVREVFDVDDDAKFFQGVASGNISEVDYAAGAAAVDASTTDGYDTDIAVDAPTLDGYATDAAVDTATADCTHDTAGDNGTIATAEAVVCNQESEPKSMAYKSSVPVHGADRAHRRFRRRQIRREQQRKLHTLADEHNTSVSSGVSRSMNHGDFAALGMGITGDQDGYGAGDEQSQHPLRRDHTIFSDPTEELAEELDTQSCPDFSQQVDEKEEEVSVQDSSNTPPRIEQNASDIDCLHQNYSIQGNKSPVPGRHDHDPFLPNTVSIKTKAKSSTVLEKKSPVTSVPKDVQQHPHVPATSNHFAQEVDEHEVPVEDESFFCSPVAQRRRMFELGMVKKSTPSPKVNNSPPVAVVRTVVKKHSQKAMEISPSASTAKSERNFFAMDDPKKHPKKTMESSPSASTAKSERSFFAMDDPKKHPQKTIESSPSASIAKSERSFFAMDDSDIFHFNGEDDPSSPARVTSARKQGWNSPLASKSTSSSDAHFKAENVTSSPTKNASQGTRKGCNSSLCSVSHSGISQPQAAPSSDGGARLDQKLVTHVVAQKDSVTEVEVDSTKATQSGDAAKTEVAPSPTFVVKGEKPLLVRKAKGANDDAVAAKDPAVTAKDQSKERTEGEGRSYFNSEKQDKRKMPPFPVSGRPKERYENHVRLIRDGENHAQEPQRIASLDEPSSVFQTDEKAMFANDLSETAPDSDLDGPAEETSGIAECQNIVLDDSRVGSPASSEGLEYAVMQASEESNSVVSDGRTREQQLDDFFGSFESDGDDDHDRKERDSDSDSDSDNDADVILSQLDITLDDSVWDIILEDALADITPAISGSEGQENDAGSSADSMERSVTSKCDYSVGKTKEKALDKEVDARSIEKRDICSGGEQAEVAHTDDCLVSLEQNALGSIDTLESSGTNGNASLDILGDRDCDMSSSEQDADECFEQKALEAIIETLACSPERIGKGAQHQSISERHYSSAKLSGTNGDKVQDYVVYTSTSNKTEATSLSELEEVESSREPNKHQREINQKEECMSIIAEKGDVPEQSISDDNTAGVASLDVKAEYAGKSEEVETIVPTMDLERAVEGAVEGAATGTVGDVASITEMEHDYVETLQTGSLTASDGCADVLQEPVVSLKHVVTFQECQNNLEESCVEVEVAADAENFDTETDCVPVSEYSTESGPSTDLRDDVSKQEDVGPRDLSCSTTWSDEDDGSFMNQVLGDEGRMHELEEICFSSEEKDSLPGSVDSNHKQLQSNDSDVSSVIPPGGDSSCNNPDAATAVAGEEDSVELPRQECLSVSNAKDKAQEQEFFVEELSIETSAADLPVEEEDMPSPDEEDKRQVQHLAVEPSVEPARPAILPVEDVPSTDDKDASAENSFAEEPPIEPSAVEDNSNVEKLELHDFVKQVLAVHERLSFLETIYSDENTPDEISAKEDVVDDSRELSNNDAQVVDVDTEVTLLRRSDDDKIPTSAEVCVLPSFEPAKLEVPSIPDVEDIEKPKTADSESAFENAECLIDSPDESTGMMMVHSTEDGLECSESVSYVSQEQVFSPGDDSISTEEVVEDSKADVNCFKDELDRAMRSTHETDMDGACLLDEKKEATAEATTYRYGNTGGEGNERQLSQDLRVTEEVEETSVPDETAHGVRDLLLELSDEQMEGRSQSERDNQAKLDTSTLSGYSRHYFSDDSFIENVDIHNGSCQSQSLQHSDDDSKQCQRSVNETENSNGASNESLSPPLGSRGSHDGSDESQHRTLPSNSPLDSTPSQSITNDAAVQITNADPNGSSDTAEIMNFLGGFKQRTARSTDESESVTTATKASNGHVEDKVPESPEVQLVNEEFATQSTETDAYSDGLSESNVSSQPMSESTRFQDELLRLKAKLKSKKSIKEGDDNRASLVTVPTAEKKVTDARKMKQLLEKVSQSKNFRLKNVSNYILERARDSSAEAGGINEDYVSAYSDFETSQVSNNKTEIEGLAESAGSHKYDGPNEETATQDTSEGPLGAKGATGLTSNRWENRMKSGFKGVSSADVESESLSVPLGCTQSSKRSRHDEQGSPLLGREDGEGNGVSGEYPRWYLESSLNNAPAALDNNPETQDSVDDFDAVSEQPESERRGGKSPARWPPYKVPRDVDHGDFVTPRLIEQPPSPIRSNRFVPAMLTREEKDRLDGSGIRRMRFDAPLSQKEEAPPPSSESEKLTMFHARLASQPALILQQLANKARLLAQLSSVSPSDENIVYSVWDRVLDYEECVMDFDHSSCSSDSNSEDKSQDYREEEEIKENYYAAQSLIPRSDIMYLQDGDFVDSASNHQVEPDPDSPSVFSTSVCEPVDAKEREIDESVSQTVASAENTSVSMPISVDTKDTYIRSALLRNDFYAGVTEQEQLTRFPGLGDQSGSYVKSIAERFERGSSNKWQNLPSAQQGTRSSSEAFDPFGIDGDLEIIDESTVAEADSSPVRIASFKISNDDGSVYIPAAPEAGSSEESNDSVISDSVISDVLLNEFADAESSEVDHIKIASFKISTEDGSVYLPSTREEESPDGLKRSQDSKFTHAHTDEGCTSQNDEFNLVETVVSVDEESRANGLDHLEDIDEKEIARRIASSDLYGMAEELLEGDDDISESEAIEFINDLSRVMSLDSTDKDLNTGKADAADGDSDENNSILDENEKSAGAPPRRQMEPSGIEPVLSGEVLPSLPVDLLSDPADPMHIEATFTVFRDLFTDTLSSWHLPKLFHEDTQHENSETANAQTSASEVATTSNGDTDCQTEPKDDKRQHQMIANTLNGPSDLNNTGSCTNQSPNGQQASHPTQSEDKENNLDSLRPLVSSPTETSKSIDQPPPTSETNMNQLAAATPIPILPNQGTPADKPAESDTNFTTGNDSSPTKIRDAKNSTAVKDVHPVVASSTPKHPSKIAAKARLTRPPPPFETIEVKSGMKRKDKQKRGV